MNHEITIAAVAALPGIAAAYFAFRRSIKANEETSKNEVRKIELGAYERARHLYEEGIRQLEEQVHRLREQVTDEQKVSDNLRNRVRDLELTISLLRSQLIKVGFSFGSVPQNGDIANKGELL